MGKPCQNTCCFICQILLRNCLHFMEELRNARAVRVSVNQYELKIYVRCKDVNGNVVTAIVHVIDFVEGLFKLMNEYYFIFFMISFLKHDLNNYQPMINN